MQLFFFSQTSFVLMEMKTLLFSMDTFFDDVKSSV